jgi:outer membrane protein assembly factor BamE (lipoprotein component of BamABCDE complex)
MGFLYSVIRSVIRSAVRSFQAFSAFPAFSTAMYNGWKAGPLLVCMVCMVVAVSSCTHSVAQHSYIDEQEKFQDPKAFIGKTESQIIEQCGQPSFISIYQPRTLFYSGYVMKRYIFLKPKTVDQHVIAFELDPQGKVKATNIIDLRQQKQVSISDGKTATIGKDTSFVDQLIQNIGQIDQDMHQ